jgi:hypothetical protein
MPIGVSFEEPTTFVIHATQNVTSAEMKSSLRTVLGHDRFRPGALILVDARAMSGAPPTDEMREVAGAMPPLVDAGLSAMAIVSDRQSIYGVARMFSALAEPFGARVSAFRTVDEARAWLSGKEA